MGLPIILTIVLGIILLAVVFYVIARASGKTPYHADPSAWLQPPAPIEPELPPAATIPPDYQKQVSEFQDTRSTLQDSYFKICSQSGRPRGLRWKSCDFDSEVLFVIENHSLNLHALVPVVISFEAIEGGPMEDMEAVGNLRVGSALFVHTGEHWGTRGDIIYNLSPDEAFQHFSQNYTAFQQDTETSSLRSDAGSQPPSE
ncbi:MAG: hypothetical protein VW875_05060 [Planctomycetaceae bacterium]